MARLGWGIVFKLLINGLIGMLQTVIQLICYVPNQVVTSLLPDVSSKISEITSVFGTVYSSLYWALGLIPTPIQNTLIFIVTVEIAKHTIHLSTSALIKVWTVLKRIKFW